MHPPISTRNLQLHMEQLTLKKTQESAEQLLYSTTWSQVGEAETRSRQIPQPQQSDPQLDGIK